jgi:hypothetical protein
MELLPEYISTIVASDRMEKDFPLGKPFEIQPAWSQLSAGNTSCDVLSGAWEQRD